MTHFRTPFCYPALLNQFSNATLSGASTTMFNHFSIPLSPTIYLRACIDHVDRSEVTTFAENGNQSIVSCTRNRPRILRVQTCSIQTNPHAPFRLFLLDKTFVILSRVMRSLNRVSKIHFLKKKELIFITEF